MIVLNPRHGSSVFVWDAYVESSCSNSVAVQIRTSPLMLLSMPITVFTVKPNIMSYHAETVPVPIASPYVFHGSDCQKSRTTYSKGCRPIGSGSPAALRRSWVRSPEGANFHLRLKKLPRLSHVQSTVEPGLTHKTTGPRVRVGQEFGDFLNLLWEGHSTSQTMPWGRSYPCRSIFFWMIKNCSLRHAPYDSSIFLVIFWQLFVV